MRPRVPRRAGGELEELRLARLGSLAAAAVQHAVEALAIDSERARAVIEGDDEIDSQLPRASTAGLVERSRYRLRSRRISAGSPR